jgi:membrane glycosyltransferase
MSFFQATEGRPAGRTMPDMPPESHLAMPVQSLRKWRGRRPIRRGLTPALVHFERFFVMALTFGLTALGTYEIHGVVSVTAPTWLQILFATLFAITFAWIAFAAASAVLGFFHVLEKRPAAASKGAVGRNALLMPIYNEDPERVFATLERMGRELHAEGAAPAFDIFILSDTQDELRGRREWLHFQDLRRRLSGATGTPTARLATSPISSPASGATTTTW